MIVETRAIEKQDYSAVYELVKNELGYADTDYNSFISRLDEMELLDAYSIFIAVKDGEIVGFVGLQKGIAFELDSKYFRIIAFAVNSKYQGQGIGTQIIDYVQHLAEQNGVNAIAVTSGLHREQTHRFYTKNGYEKKGFSFAKLLEE